jgi:cell division protein FtsB
VSRNQNKNKNKRYSKSEGSSSSMRVIVVLFFIILFAVGASMYVSQNASLSRVTTKSDALAEKMAEASMENEDAKALKQKVGTDTFIEDMARNQLGMVKSGETIFKTEN